jgi:hypothetical protein
MSYTKINNKKRMSNNELREYVYNKCKKIDDLFKYYFSPICPKNQNTYKSCCLHVMIGIPFLIISTPFIIIILIGDFSFKIYLDNRTDEE